MANLGTPDPKTPSMLLDLGAFLVDGQAEESYEPYTPLCQGKGATSNDLHHCYKSMLPFHPLLRGLYAEQLERWLRVFDRSQILIVDSAEMLFDLTGTSQRREFLVSGPFLIFDPHPAVAIPSLISLGIPLKP